MAEIRHIGIFRALCDGRKKARLRTDLPASQYRALGGKDRFEGEKPYKVCRACIKLSQDWRFLTWGKRRKPPVARTQSGGRDG